MNKKFMFKIFVFIIVIALVFIFTISYFIKLYDNKNIEVSVTSIDIRNLNQNDLDSIDNNQIDYNMLENDKEKIRSDSDNYQCILITYQLKNLSNNIELFDIKFYPKFITSIKDIVIGYQSCNASIPISLQIMGSQTFQQKIFIESGNLNKPLIVEGIKKSKVSVKYKIVQTKEIGNLKCVDTQKRHLNLCYSEILS